VTTIGTFPMSAFGGIVHDDRDQPFPRLALENAISDGLRALEEAADFRDGRVDLGTLSVRFATRPPRAGEIDDVLVVSVEADVEVPL
jgi:hypothetical protein